MQQIARVDHRVFESQWLIRYKSIFLDRDFDSAPFLQAAWRPVCVGAPAFYFCNDTIELTDYQKRHADIYRGLSDAISLFGDNDIIGFLRGGPHGNTSAFYSPSTNGCAMFQMRQQAVEGFDLHIFSKSAQWGVVVSWEEELALVGGTEQMMNRFEQASGGRAVLKDDFESSSAYLLELGEEKRRFVTKLGELYG